jgi:hypothetical protein
LTTHRPPPPKSSAEVKERIQLFLYSLLCAFMAGYALIFNSLVLSNESDVHNGMYHLQKHPEVVQKKKFTIEFVFTIWFE